MRVKRGHHDDLMVSSPAHGRAYHPMGEPSTQSEVLLEKLTRLVGPFTTHTLDHGLRVPGQLRLVPLSPGDFSRDGIRG